MDRKQLTIHLSKEACSAPGLPEALQSQLGSNRVVSRLVESPFESPLVWVTFKTWFLKVNWIHKTYQLKTWVWLILRERDQQFILLPFPSSLRKAMQISGILKLPKLYWLLKFYCAKGPQLYWRLKEWEHNWTDVKDWDLSSSSDVNLMVQGNHCKNPR